MAGATRSHVCNVCNLNEKRGKAVHEPCALCGLTDLRMLSVVELEGGRAVLCRNHAALLSPLVRTLDDVRTEVVFARTGIGSRCLPLDEAPEGGSLLDELVAQVVEVEEAA